jgi:hypothetical protein
MGFALFNFKIQSSFPEHDIIDHVFVHGILLCAHRQTPDKTSCTELLLQVLSFELLFKQNDKSDELSAEHGGTPFCATGCDRL